MKQYLLIILFLTATLLPGMAQNGRPNYPFGDFLAVGGGSTRLSLRDQGVSPLYYDGFLALGQMEFQTRTPRYSWSLYGSYGYGTLKASRLATYQSSIHHISYGSDYLRGVKDLGARWQLAAGAHLQGMTNIRYNPSFRNAGSTAESINSLGASAKITWLIDRERSKRRFLWIFPVRHNRRVQQLSYQLNIPLLTAIWSPAFPYLDDFTEGTVDYLQKNELKWGGIRLSNRFNYLYYLKNGNALRLTYHWEVFQGPDDFGRIGLGQHQAAFAFLIRLNELSHAQ